jgi:MscS family membrane protein
MQPIFERVFLGNTVEAYCWFAGIIIGGLLFKALISKVLSKLMYRFIKKYSRGVSFEKFLMLVQKPLGIFILLITFYMAMGRLDFPAEWKIVSRETFGIRMVLFRLFQVDIIFSFTWIVLRFIDFFGLILLYRASLTESKTDDQLVPFLKETLKVLFAIFSFFFMMGTVFNINIASLIAGLGIGGLAIALAAKESLENLLGSFTIFLDKPFIIGDQIKIGDTTGIVEKIGFRSTRLRTPEKSFVTVPNKKLVEAELDNLSLRTFQRAKFSIGLSVETQPSLLKKVMGEIQQFIDEHPRTNQDGRVKLYEINSTSFFMMILFFVETNNADVYLDVREEINFKILEILRENNCRLSTAVFPTIPTS